jgi:hypothetical protein
VQSPEGLYFFGSGSVVLTFFSSLVGGFFRLMSNGAYKKFSMAIPKSIHSNPIFLTKVPLIAGPECPRKNGVVIVRIIMNEKVGNKHAQIPKLDMKTTAKMPRRKRSGCATRDYVNIYDYQ